MLVAWKLPRLVSLVRQRLVLTLAIKLLQVDSEEAHINIRLLLRILLVARFRRHLVLRRMVLLMTDSWLFWFESLALRVVRLVPGLRSKVESVVY